MDKFFRLYKSDEGAYCLRIGRLNFWVSNYYHPKDTLNDTSYGLSFGVVYHTRDKQ